MTTNPYHGIKPNFLFNFTLLLPPPPPYVNHWKYPNPQSKVSTDLEIFCELQNFGNADLAGKKTQVNHNKFEIPTKQFGGKSNKKLNSAEVMDLICSFLNENILSLYTQHNLLNLYSLCTKKNLHYISLAVFFWWFRYVKINWVLLPIPMLFDLWSKQR